MKFLVVLQCIVAVAVAVPRPQGYSYGLPRFSGDANLIGAGSSSPFASLSSVSGSGSSQSFSAATTFGQQASRQYAPEVQKHIYVHVPPPDHEVLPAPRVVTYDRPVKHYKIIFIKAPSPTPQQQPVLPAPLQNEEKTLVYVLVKRPDRQPDLHLPTPAPTVPAKPEVYFIKYNSKKEGGAGALPVPSLPSVPSVVDARVPSLPQTVPQSGSASSLNHLTANAGNAGTGFAQQSGGFSQGNVATGLASTASRVSLPHTQYGVPL